MTQLAVVSLATLAALVLLGLVLSHWTWVWLAPRPEPRAQAMPPGDGSIKAAYALFAVAPSAIADAATAGVQVQLLGIAFPADGRAGYALLRPDAKESMALRAGVEIEPGLRLAEIHVDHVVIERGGIRSVLGLPEPGRAVEATAPLAGN